MPSGRSRCSTGGTCSPRLAEHMGELAYRAVSAEDGASLAVVLSDPEVARWLRSAGSVAPFSPAECAHKASEDAAHWAAHGFGSWIVLDEGAVVARGGPRFRVLDGRAELEIAWAVVSSRWGQGIATAVGRAAMSAAAERGAAEVVAFTRTDNVASLRVMEKLSMTREREFLLAGLPHVLARASIAGQ